MNASFSRVIIAKYANFLNILFYIPFTLLQPIFSNPLTPKPNINYISYIALASICCLREKAGITKAAKIDDGLVPPEYVHLVLAQNKLKRAERKFFRYLEEQFGKEIENKGIQCFLL